MLVTGSLTKVLIFEISPSWVINIEKYTLRKKTAQKTKYIISFNFPKGYKFIFKEIYR